MFSRILFTIFCIVFALGGGGNTYCYQCYNGQNLIRFEGKMSVPIKPVTEPNAVLFYWPGVNPWSGLMQPVLIYGVDYGQGPNKWGMANWYTNCKSTPSGYCNNGHKAVVEGDVLKWSVYRNGNTWEMHWESYNYPGLSDTFNLAAEPASAYPINCVWGTESELYLDPTVPNNWSKLPLSNYYTWDMVGTDAFGRQVKLDWATQIDDPNGERVDCNYRVVNNGQTLIATEIQNPPYNNGCDNGWSRVFNYGCQSFCGCVNKDGTPKVICDYCCRSDKGYCEKQNGPSYTYEDILEDLKKGGSNQVRTGNETHPYPGFKSFQSLGK